MYLAHETQYVLMNDEEVRCLISRSMSNAGSSIKIDPFAW
jgi:hypothetical protein